MKKFKFTAFWQALTVIVVVYFILANAFPPVMPATLLVQYMIIVIAGVLLYFAFDENRWQEFKAPLKAVLTESRLAALRWGLLIVIPLIIAYNVYQMVKPSTNAPVELRQVHPAPPSKLKVFNKTFDLTSLQNPVRQRFMEAMKVEPEAAKAQYGSSVDAGQKVYYQNCFYCHGDLLDGQGPIAKAFNPAPANFQDVGTIAQLQEAFLFWRITTGGPGLPKEGTPWNSAMPVWHEMLDEEQVWDVITFLYDYVGQVPRMWDAEESKLVTANKDELVRTRKNSTPQELYQFRCAACHGEEGMGDGFAADYLYPRPRDFSLGIFKYKSTQGSTPPSDADLFNTIKVGLTGTGMPGWKTLLSDDEIKSLIPVIKGFDTAMTWAPDGAEDEDFDDEGRYLKQDFNQYSALEPQDGQIAYSEESVAKGKPVFVKVCGECHGKEGRGNIISGKKLTDDWGYRLWPRDLTKPWLWRATASIDGEKKDQVQQIADIYQRLSIGIPGTPMPAHRAVEEGNEDPISLEDRWHVANYVYSLRDKATPLSDQPVITATKVTGELPNTGDDPQWQDAKATGIRLAPNVIKGERLFTPLADQVSVKVLYNDDNISFLLELNDRTNSRPGEKVSMGIQDEALEMFADAFAIQFPLQESFVTKPVVEKPLYRHGDKSHPTSIWYWNAGSVEPQIPAMTMVFDGTGPNSKLKPRMSDKSVTASGQWKNGKWQVLMTRSRSAGESGDVAFNEGKFIPISIANWDGSNGETKSRHTLTSWYWLILPPELDTVRVYGIPAGIAGVVFLLGLLLVRSQRKQE